MSDGLRKGLLRGLIYPVQFTKDPITDIERVLDQVVRARAMDAAPEEYLAAVQAGLKSDLNLSDLIPQPHGEAVIRAYLAAMEKRLETETSEQAAEL